MIIFYCSAFVAVLATLLAVTRLNAVHALLYFIVSLLAVASVFFQLGAPFLAALEIIIYAGAIMVLFVFVVMMLNLGRRAEEQERQLFAPGMLIGPTVLAVLLGIELMFLLSARAPSGTQGGAIPPQQVGTALYLVYPLAVELAGLLLMAGLVGAFHLGRDIREDLPRAGQESLKRRFTTTPDLLEEHNK